MNYDVKLEPDEGGIWTAEVPALGIVTEGRGEVGARRAADRAIAGYLKGLEHHGLPVPPSDITRTQVLRAGARASVTLAPYVVDLFGGMTGKKSAARKKAVAKEATGKATNLEEGDQDQKRRVTS